MANGDIPDKNYLYGMYQKSADWRDKLHKRLAHKSLDMQLDDDMHVDNSRAQFGITWKELAVVALSVIGGFYVYGEFSKPDSQPQQQPQSGPIDSEYEVRFFDAAGNQIDIPQVKRKE